MSSSADTSSADALAMSGNVDEDGDLQMSRTRSEEEDPNPREDPGTRIMLPREQLDILQIRAAGLTDEMMTNLQIAALYNSDDVREMLELAQEMRTFARQMTMLTDFMVRIAESIMERQMRQEARHSSTD